MNDVLAMHMQKERNCAAHVKKSCDMCSFTSHLSCVLKNHIERKHLGILKILECNICDFSAKSTGVLKHHEHLLHKKATLSVMCEV